jgi:hypothetical protein
VLETQLEDRPDAVVGNERRHPLGVVARHDRGISNDQLNFVIRHRTDVIVAP